jgi:hypothetical protein
VKVQIAIEIEEDQLANYTDQRLAVSWHVAQANPAPFGDHDAGALTERIGREIIRRWLRDVPPELWSHQGRDNYWKELCQLGTWVDGVFVPGDPLFPVGTPGSVHREDSPARDPAGM